jgi:hypothetical protein
VDRFVSGVHSAFGDVTEPAHIVAPALGFFERIVVTPPGSPLPRLDDDIVESAESMAERKNTRSVGNWNTVDTYTFSFYSMNIDLPTWSLVGLPVSGDVSLTTFWGDSALKICMYEKLGSDRQHRTDTIRYVFALQVSTGQIITVHVSTLHSLPSYASYMPSPAQVYGSRPRRRV